MYDVVQYLNKSLIQHGKMNDRIYLMNLALEDKDSITKELDILANANNYSKIFAKIPAILEDKFLASGYIREAYIPNFYKGEQDCCFVAKFLNAQRKSLDNKNSLDDVIAIAQSKSGKACFNELNNNMLLRVLKSNDTEAMVDVYKVVFKTYPFPIHDKKYLLSTMKENVVYYGIFEDNKLFAIASSELSPKNLNAEMTDFAILPEYRGKNYALNLLYTMEEDLIIKGYKALYTIARGVSYGMNITFAKMNYVFSGRLINNTNISEGIESMNVWYKLL